MECLILSSVEITTIGSPKQLSGRELVYIHLYSMYKAWTLAIGHWQLNVAALDIRSTRYGMSPVCIIEAVAGVEIIWLVVIVITIIFKKCRPTESSDSVFVI